MNAARSARPAYWHSGGAIISRPGPLTVQRALALFRFFGRQTALCHRRGDRCGARHCAHQALDLARAIVDSEDWRSAAHGSARSKAAYTALRTLTLDLSRNA